jgi:bifunctional UDP-N-acetylglucosamine pyrophosphorylase/glucosamine-1-phosphate N-acetyltransferase
MIDYVLDAVTTPSVVGAVVVVGHQHERLEAAILTTERPLPLRFALQTQQLGTGHAVLTALPEARTLLGEGGGDIVILPGDAPLLLDETIAALLKTHADSGADLTVLTATLDNPTGYGRIVHGPDGTLVRIVEERDATAQERAITEVNTSIMVGDVAVIADALEHVGRHNAQGEYYLTDAIEQMAQSGLRVVSWLIDDASQVWGVNDPTQLANAEAQMVARNASDRPSA